MPKSQTFTSSIGRLVVVAVRRGRCSSGFTSRWTMPRACACAEPRADLHPMSMMRGSGSGPARMEIRRSSTPSRKLHREIEEAVRLLAEVEDAHQFG